MVTYREAEGKCRDGVSYPVFPENNFIASRYGPNLKLAPKPESPGLASRPLSQKEWRYVSVCCLQCPGCGSLPRTVSDYYSFMGPRNAGPLGLQYQAIIGHPQGKSHKNWSPDVCISEIYNNTWASRGRADDVHWLEQGRGGVQRWQLPRRGKKGKIRKEKKRKVKGKKKKNFKKEKIWHLPALVRHRESVEDGAHQLEHKDGTC